MNARHMPGELGVYDNDATKAHLFLTPFSAR